MECRTKREKGVQLNEETNLGGYSFLIPGAQQRGHSNKGPNKGGYPLLMGRPRTGWAQAKRCR